METIFLNIAGFNIKVKFPKMERSLIKDHFKYIKTSILSYYQGFILDIRPKKIDFFINIIWDKKSEVLYSEKIQKKFIFFYKIKQKNKISCSYRISMPQFELIIRAILQQLLINSGFELHCSAVGINKMARVFVGQPGAGKSTVANLLGSKYSIIADDTAIIKEENDKFCLYQTPFIETKNWINRKSKRIILGKIYFLRKANFYKIEKLKDKKYILNRMIVQVFNLINQKEKFDNFGGRMKNIIEFVECFNKFYFLYFGKNRKRLIELIEKSNF